MKKITKIEWLNKPVEHDYPAARSYLSLLYEKDEVEAIITQFKKAKINYFKAKDILRASKVLLLDLNDFEVKKDYKRITKGVKLSPILLVRDKSTGSVIIADGYHRVCVVYHLKEKDLIPCKIVSFK